MDGSGVPYDGRFDRVWHEANPDRLPGSKQAYLAGCRCWACNSEQAEREFNDLAGLFEDAMRHSRAGWRAEAACAGADPELFFPDRRGARPAKRICRDCPVLIECLVWSLEDPDPDHLMITAGMGGKHRRELTRVFRDRPHKWAYDQDCTCESCTALTLHVRRTRGEKGVPVSAAGTALTPGLAASYNKGLRDPQSRLAKADLSLREAAPTWDYSPDVLARIAAEVLAA